MSNTLSNIVARVEAGERVAGNEAAVLWNEAPLWLLGRLAMLRKRAKSEDKVFYNRNFHIEPSNICHYACRFCSYRRSAGSDDAWELSIDRMVEEARNRAASGATEVHIVGGAHPDRSIYFYTELVRRIHEALPSLHIKAFTAVEIDWMCRLANMSTAEGLERLHAAGLESLPGGGAEIFAPVIRKEICPEKCSGEEWLRIHREAHELGIDSNATMLYGHIETVLDRIDHLIALRRLQDVTHGFNAFIPLKYRSAGNAMSHLGEVAVTEDMRTLAMSRILLDNFDHIKAYWVMYGKAEAEMALSFGADDIDGTIDDSTRIYSMAGAEEQNPTLTIEEIEQMCANVGLRAVERDTHYNELSK